MRVTRHNGRSGKNGVYNVKHNDRDFDVRNSEHIHDNKVKQNLYWDWMQGGRTEINKKRKPLSFEQVEKKYYEEHYSDYLEGQNARYIKNRHKEKIRTMDDLLNDKKICPEETILQIGNMNDSVSLTELANIAFEYFDEFKKRYGDHVHILDWALHMDEATPHIHERHVFDYVNDYGELQLKQEKALEALGFELPFPEKKPSKNNNRKIAFDSECRKLFLDICEKHIGAVEREPIYGGKQYLEKNDFIIQKQNQEIQTNQRKEEELILRISDTEKLLDDVSRTAYETACNAVNKEIIKATRDKDIAVIKGVRKEIAKEKWAVFKFSIAEKIIQDILDRLNKLSESTIKFAKQILIEHKEENITQIKQQAKVSISQTLEAKKKQLEQQRQGIEIEKQNNREKDISL